jgi:hypothetical protein
MFYRMIVTDPLDKEAETGTQVEGLFTAAEIEQIRERYYGLDWTTGLILARPACGNCEDCERAGKYCNR